MECTICYEAIGVARTTLECAHAFHPRCLTHWFSSQLGQDRKESCPCCRYEASDLERLPLCETAADSDAEDAEDAVEAEKARQRWDVRRSEMAPAELEAFAIRKIMATIRGFWARRTYYILLASDVKRKRSERIMFDHAVSVIRATARIKLYLQSASMTRSEWKAAIATRIQFWGRRCLLRKKKKVMP